MTPATHQLIASLDPQWHEFYSERAAILEYSCHIPRETAEDAAWQETSAAMLKSRILKMQEHQHSIPKPLAIPKREPSVSRKELAGGA